MGNTVLTAAQGQQKVHINIRTEIKIDTTWHLFLLCGGFLLKVLTSWVVIFDRLIGRT